MIICGIKLTHDGSVALIDEGKLIFSVEIEKIDNNLRYSKINDLAVITEILEKHGYSMDDVDQFVIDGWHGNNDFRTGESILARKNGDTISNVKVAPYRELHKNDDILQEYSYNGLTVSGKIIEYLSYTHVSGHIMSAYATSSFAKDGQSSFVMVWDGGTYPRLYYFNAENENIENLGHLFNFLGTAYSILPQYFGPYKKSEQELSQERKEKAIEGFFGGLSVAGKIMAYIALGKVSPLIIKEFVSVHKQYFEVSNEFEHVFAQKVKKRLQNKNYNDADILASFHAYLEGLLISNLKKAISKLPNYQKNLCIVGGCGLNIKWNSAIRASGVVDNLWVPPFCNDSGSALGAACNAMFKHTSHKYLNWNVYSGPKIIKNAPAQGWLQENCSLDQLAKLLHESNEPVVFLNDKAELGPRSLGNRSILAAPTSSKMKEILNAVKKREEFRPVSPICLEEHAQEIFIPGVRDPFMLFDHKIKDDWKDKIQAVIHLDDTVRLQTLRRDENETVYELISKYYTISGIPMLCNTSANYNGKGFFPDVFSATNWGRVNYVWCNNTLYSREEKLQLV
jgi:carbamoyltransferase